MSLTPSTMLELGTSAPEFDLPDIDGSHKKLSDYAENPALLVIFMCNHCPYVKHLSSAFVELANEYQPRGVAIVGISSNSAESHPQDGPEAMRVEAEKAGYQFPYLYDKSQEVAKAYRAACTPDFFLFDKQKKLVYRGQYDDSRPGNNKAISGYDLKNALDTVLKGELPSLVQEPSMGCGIKWRTGNEPDYSG